MSYAWMYGCARWECICGLWPKELKIDRQVLADAKAIAEETGATIEVSHMADCLKDADVIYTDVWCSMEKKTRFLSE